MPVLTVAETRIPYEIRRSRRARRLRIAVEPGRVEVVAPVRTWSVTIDAFVREHRAWIFENYRRFREREAAGEFSTEQRYVAGATIRFRGRRLKLDVVEADVPSAELTYRSAFHVRVPHGLSGKAREETVKSCLDSWLTDRARVDADDLVRRYAPLIGREPKGIRIKSQKTLWGSCSANGVIALNRRLLAAPKPIFEYVVVHELCHLVEHNHGPRFWKLVGSLLSDYRERRSWLKQHGIALK